MTIIYNESITTEHIQAHQKHNRSLFIRYICSVLGVCVFGAVMMAATVYDVQLSSWLLWPAVAIGTVSLLMLIGAQWEGGLEEDPEPDIIYAEKTKNRRVLDVTIERHDHGWHRNVPFVVMRTEDANGLVEKTELCLAKFQESTKHTEETFDVNQGIVFVPYKGQSNS